MKTIYNGYSFDDANTRKKMKYIIVLKGDLDLNGCYAFKSLRELREYLKDSHREVQAVFKIQDITLKET